MAKKKSCQNVRRPQVLSEAKRELYGWVDENIFSQPSVINADMLPKLRQGISLTEGGASKGDYVIEAAGPSDRRRIESTSSASQLHLNGWGFLRTFERVCLHFGFRPSWHVFLHIYDMHIPSTGKGFISFCAHQGQRLFDAFEKSVQKFKWHYFKSYRMEKRDNRSEDETWRQDFTLATFSKRGNRLSRKIP
ncbi:hypothetical protein PIB30_060667 [Stylosanthes scabra]|uniref:Uncharacterized protein n=1 Tax=Stylosanthes scabra TaxID=79078 RepID=A0ABU6XIG7_9FABA|nr:hypothetical protein [Stylosanthes scabra]